MCWVVKGRTGSLLVHCIVGTHAPNVDGVTSLNDISLPESHADTREDDSVPVLFIPGSSGSKAQARSIASEAYRYAARQNPHANHSSFAVYTVGTNEELSALDARLVNSQVHFVSRCLQYLQTLHTSPVAIIVGHSMGTNVFLIPHITAHSSCEVCVASLASQQLGVLHTPTASRRIVWSCRGSSCKSCRCEGRDFAEYAGGGGGLTMVSSTNNDSALCCSPELGSELLHTN